LQDLQSNRVIVFRWSWVAEIKGDTSLRLADSVSTCV
jgi:hypothetical protein